MIRYIEGDIFSTPAQTIVNTVNTVGVMGKGIALEFKKRYPDMFQAYKTACEKKKLRIGKLMLYYEPDHWVLMFPTKENWRNPSKIEYIEQGLMKFRNTYAEMGITSIAFPKLGCGNGDLDWNDVRPVMEKYLRDLPIDIFVYTKQIKDTLPEHKAIKDMTPWLKKNAKDLSFDGICDELNYNYSIVPYTFIYGSGEVNALWRKKLIFSDENGVECMISEDDFFSLWDDIRSKGIISKSASEETNLVYGFLYSLGYLSRIRTSNGENDEEGYQVNEGLGRFYSLEGNENGIQTNN